VRRAWRGATQPRRTYREALVLRDLVAFRRRFGHVLRAAPVHGDAARVALIVSLSDFVFQLKVEGMLAKALQLQGFRPVILTWKSARWAEPYFRTFGIEDFVYAEKLLPPGGAEEAEQ